jgi:hypothetical protein
MQTFLLLKVLVHVRWPFGFKKFNKYNPIESNSTLRRPPIVTIRPVSPTELRPPKENQSPKKNNKYRMTT